MELNRDICTLHFVEFYYICPTKAQYILIIMFLKSLLHVSMFIYHPSKHVGDL